MFLQLNESLSLNLAWICHMCIGSHFPKSFICSVFHDDQNILVIWHFPQATIITGYEFHGVLLCLWQTKHLRSYYTIKYASIKNFSSAQMFTFSSLKRKFFWKIKKQMLISLHKGKLKIVYCDKCKEGYSGKGMCDGLREQIF